MQFTKAVQADGLGACLEPGMRALKGNSKRVDAAAVTLTGSVDLDDALKAEQPNASRWDYLLGIRRTKTEDELVCIEVHGADVNQVAVMLHKKAWLDGYLKGKNLGTMPRSVHWISTDAGIHMPKSSPQFRALAKAGIPVPVRLLRLN